MYDAFYFYQADLTCVILTDMTLWNYAMAEFLLKLLHISGF